ncbi:MAG: HAD family hydrolase [Muribaculaceae bacterium]|nr:HAD family hydrolase [Muribaculaceae bacterium]
MKEIKGALFDLDGVLLDSEGIYTQFWNAVEEKYPTGIPNFAHVIKGSNLFEILHDHYPTETIRQQVTEMLLGFQRTMKYEFFDGAMEFVNRLNQAGIPACVVTSSDDDKMASLARQHPDFKSHFKTIVTGDMVRHAKPDPECFLLGAQLIGVDIHDCWIFEDSLKGLAAGRASGATVIGLATTLSREVIQDKADLVIDNFNQLTI